MKRIYTSIDIGTDTVKIVVCELYKSKLNLLASTAIKSKGIKKGLITDISEVKDSIKDALLKIEEILGIQIKKAITNIPSYFAEFSIVNGEIEVTTEDKVITGKEVIEVIQSAIKIDSDPLRDMVTVIPIDFKVGDSVILDPKGVIGDNLKTRAVMVTTPKKNIYSVVGILESMGIEVADISLGSIGDLYSFKNKDIDNTIGVVINVGSEITTISLFNKGIIIKNTIIQLGGKNIDNDIAYIYKINLNEAKKLKEKFAMAHKNYASLNEIIEINNKLGETIRINQVEITEIVSSRIEEILNLAKKEINGLAKRPIDYIIVTGGTSNISYFDRIVEEVLGKEATVGNMKLVGLRDNRYSSCLGNIVYFIHKLRLKGKNYTMVDKDDIEILSSPRKNNANETNIWEALSGFFSE